MVGEAYRVLPSLPGLTRQSICPMKRLVFLMDARVKPGHDEEKVD
jgi:hypothetical protein